MSPSSPSKPRNRTLVLSFRLQEAGLALPRSAQEAQNVESKVTFAVSVSAVKPLLQNGRKSEASAPWNYVKVAARLEILLGGPATNICPHPLATIKFQSREDGLSLEARIALLTFYTVKGAGHGRFNDPKVPEMTREFWRNT